MVTFKMTKKLCLVLGNGFSIDLIKHANLDSNIDVMNLFSKGVELPWPEDGESGFLSFKHCPNLWHLGARPNMSSSAAMTLLENIITCVNVYVLKPRPDLKDGSTKPNQIYINAYFELISYLRVLFSHYNSQVTDEDLKEKTKDWPWINFIKRANDSAEYESISIITYNYDIWLERLLKIHNISFNISMMNGGAFGENSKVTLVKPHGSISYYHKKQNIAGFSIGYNKPIPVDATIDSFCVNDAIPLSNCLVNALIPPAGDTDRMKQSWSGQMRTSAAGMSRELEAGDDLIICGVSYWHVDRSELDEIFTNCSPQTNVFMINPSPNTAMDAVLTSLFSNYIYYNVNRILDKRLV